MRNGLLLLYCGFLITGCKSPEPPPRPAQSPVEDPRSQPVANPAPEAPEEEPDTPAAGQWALIYEDTSAGGEQFHFTSKSKTCALSWDSQIVVSGSAYLLKIKGSTTEVVDLPRKAKGYIVLEGNQRYELTWPRNVVFAFGAYDLKRGRAEDSAPPIVSLATQEAPGASIGVDMRESFLEAQRKLYGDQFRGDDEEPLPPGWYCPSCNQVQRGVDWKKGHLCPLCGAHTRRL